MNSKIIVKQPVRLLFKFLIPYILYLIPFTLYLIPFTFIPSMVNAQPKEVNFEKGDWKSIVEKAKKEKKTIFIYAYMQDVDGCKWMDEHIFNRDTVISFLNANFINAKIDFDNGEGLLLSEKFKTKIYPTYLYIDNDGNVIHRGNSVKYTAEFLNFSKDANDPDRQFISYTKRFEMGEKGYDFIVNYLQMLSNEYQNTDTVLDAYMKSQQENLWSSKQNFMLTKRYLKNINSPIFKFILENRPVLDSLYTKDTLDANIYKWYLNTCFDFLYEVPMNETGYLKTIDKIKESGFERTDQLITRTEVLYYEKKRKWDKLAVSFEKYIDQY